MYVTETKYIQLVKQGSGDFFEEHHPMHYTILGNATKFGGTVLIIEKAVCEKPQGS